MDQIPLFNKRLGSTGSLKVKVIEENFFEIIYNDPFDYRYESGTHIRTKINEDGFHEVTEFIKSENKTHRFLASIEQNLRDLTVFIEELYKNGGKFQIDMGGIISVTVPHDFPYDLDKVIRDYAVRVTRLK
jgi:hypothetical protein